MRWLAILLLALPSLLTAAPIAVRSGEHADFSRVVLTFPATPEWSLGRTGDGYLLRVSGNDQNFELADVFLKMSKKRVTKITQDNDGLKFDVSCICHVDAFEFRSGLLVIDIKDGPAPASSPFETAFGSDEVSAANNLPNPSPLETPTPPQDPVILTAPLNATPPIFAAAIWRNGPEIPSPKPVEKTVERSKQPVVSGPAIDLSARLRAHQMREQLLKQLGRAAAQGLVGAPPILAKNDMHPENAAAAEDPKESSADAPGSIEEHINFRTETQFDRDAPTPLSNQLAAKGADCLSARLTDVTLWSGKAGVWDNVVQARSRLADEVDNISESAAFALTRTYIFAGFGAEAVALLSSIKNDSIERDILTELALLVDGLPVGPSAKMPGQISCDGPSALWGAVAVTEWNEHAFRNTAAILTTFSGLPLHLRRELGPSLSEKFLSANDEASAMTVRNAIARADGEHGSKFDILEAELSARSGDLEKAGDALKEVVARGDVNSPQALLRLMTMRLANGTAPDEGMLINAQALMFERQGTPFASQMAPLIVAAYSVRGSHKQAVQSLLDLPSAEVQLIASVSNNVVRHANDADFLRMAFSRDFVRLSEIMPEDVQVSFSQRLSALGFSERVSQELASGAPTSEVKKAKKVRAPDASRADTNLAETNDTDETTDAAPGLLAALPEQGADNLDGLPPLAKGRALIEQSKQARARAQTRLKN